VAAAFPDKDVFVGEFGWPSAGRMRESALPSPVNQAFAMHEVLDRAKGGNYRVNLIEAYDQPWKRWLEGTVGGHWGLFDAYGRRAKFAWGGAVSNHPHWPWQAAGGVGLAALVFATALAVRWRTAAAASAGWWLRLTAIAIVAGGLIGWTVANVPLESLTLGDWLRSLAWAAVALMSPVAAAAALASGTSAPSFARVLGRPVQRPSDAVTLSLGILLIALAVLSVQAALGLVFDARYRDFPFAPLTAATIPLLLARKGKPAIKGKVLATWKRRLQAPAAETAVAVTLAASAVYIVCNESFANWQAVWFSGALLALAFTLLQAQDGPS
jgi:glucan 1,3-beta-glucosidase